jgi:hypothetical protein
MPPRPGRERIGSNSNNMPTTQSDTQVQTIARDVFEHARNLVLCATLLGLGLAARERSADLLGASVFQGIIGWGVLAVAAALALLNLWVGVSRLKHWKHWKLWSLVLLAVYGIIAVRVMEVMALLQQQGK